MDSDRILVLDAGRLVESGTPAALVASRGVFYQLQKRGNEKGSAKDEAVSQAARDAHHS